MDFFLFLSFSIYLTLAAFFPGVYTNDSADQLRQALTGSYKDWYPPLMAWLWSVLIRATGHIESLLIFHLLLLFAGAIYWAKIFGHLRVWFVALFIPAFIVSPIVLNFSGVIWKDVGFAFSLLLSCGILGLSFLEQRISLSRTIAVIFLLAYAFGVRANGIFAILPVGAFLTWQIFVKYMSKSSRVKVLAFSATTSVFLLAALVVGVQFFAYKILKTEKRYPIQYLELYDIAGISKISGVDYFPDFVKLLPEHDISRVSDGYVESISIFGNANNLLFRQQDGSPSLIPLNTDSELQRQLRDSWLKAVWAEPLAYLEHRLSVFYFLMGKESYSSEKPQSYASRQFTLKVNSVEMKTVEFLRTHFLWKDSATEFVYKSISLAKGSFLYIGWSWLVLLLVELLAGLIIFRRVRSGFVVIIVSVSGLLYILPYFIVAPASDFRYLYWSVISAGISAIFIVAIAISEALKSVFAKSEINGSGGQIL